MLDKNVDCVDPVTIKNRARAAKYREANRAKYNERQREYNELHKDIINLRRRERRKEDQEYAKKIRAQDRARPKCQRKNIMLKKAYGITLDQFNKMHSDQNGMCAICGSNVGDSLGRSLHVDHCHDEGKVRGLLCSNCNTGLGKFNDNSELLFKAANYLKG